jgi:hypothetical protein
MVDKFQKQSCQSDEEEEEQLSELTLLTPCPTNLMHFLNVGTLKFRV